MPELNFVFISTGFSWYHPFGAVLRPALCRYSNVKLWKSEPASTHSAPTEKVESKSGDTVESTLKSRYGSLQTMVCIVYSCYAYLIATWLAEKRTGWNEVHLALGGEDFINPFVDRCSRSSILGTLGAGRIMPVAMRVLNFVFLFTGVLLVPSFWLNLSCRCCTYNCLLSIFQHKNFGKMSHCYLILPLHSSVFQLRKVRYRWKRTEEQVWQPPNHDMHSL